MATAVVGNGVKVATDYSEEASSELSTGYSGNGETFTVMGAKARLARRGATWEDGAPLGKTRTFSYRTQWLHTILRSRCPLDMSGKHKEAWQTIPDRSTSGAIRVKQPAKYPAWRCQARYSVPAQATTVYSEHNRARYYAADWNLPVTPYGSLVGRPQRLQPGREAHLHVSEPGTRILERVIPATQVKTACGSRAARSRKANPFPGSADDRHRVPRG